MKYMIASDIHGSFYYCKKMIERFEEEGTDKLLLLGDLLYHGPRNDLPKEYEPKKVIELLNQYKNKIFCVRGNCDCDVDQFVLDFPIMPEFALFTLGEQTVFATHGHLYNGENLPPAAENLIFLQGHTHIPVCAKMEETLVMNPGSVSIPKGGSAHSYMVWEEGAFYWKNIENGQIVQSYNF